MPPISTVNKIAKIFNGDKQIVKVFAGPNLVYKFSEGGSDMPPATGLIYVAEHVSNGLYTLDKTLTLQGTKKSAGSSYRPLLVGIYPNGDYVVVWWYSAWVNASTRHYGLIRKYSSSNNILWTWTSSTSQGFSTSSTAKRVLVDSNGDIIVHATGNSSRQKVTLKIDGTDGSRIWSKTTIENIYGDNLKLDKEDNFYTLNGTLLKKWNRNGNAIWSVTLNTNHNFGALFIDKDYNVYASVNTLSYYKCDKNGQNGSYITMEGPSAPVYGFLIDEVNGYIYTSTSTDLIQRDLNGDIIWTANLRDSSTSGHYMAGIRITEDYKTIVGLGNGLNIFTTEGERTDLYTDNGILSIAYYNPNVQPWADNS